MRFCPFYMRGAMLKVSFAASMLIFMCEFSHAEKSTQAATYDPLYGGVLKMPAPGGFVQSYRYGPFGGAVVEEVRTGMTTFYTPSGQRARDKTTSNATVYFYEDGVLPVYINSANKDAALYLDTPYGTPLIQVNLANKDIVFPVGDRQESVRGLVGWRGPGPTLQVGYGYSLLGEVAVVATNVEAASTPASPFLFQGRLSIEDTAIYDYHARLYAASVGRFMHTDILGASVSPYTAFANNAANYTDLDGLMPRKAGNGRTRGKPRRTKKKKVRSERRSEETHTLVGLGVDENGRAERFYRVNDSNELVARIRAEQTAYFERVSRLSPQIRVAYQQDTEARSHANRSADLENSTFQNLVTAIADYDVSQHNNYRFYMELLEIREKFPDSLRAMQGTMRADLRKLRMSRATEQAALDQKAEDERLEMERAVDRSQLSPQRVSRPVSWTTDTVQAQRMYVAEDAPQQRLFGGRAVAVEDSAPEFVSMPPPTPAQPSPRANTVLDIFGTTNVTYRQLKEEMARRRLKYKQKTSGGDKHWTFAKTEKWVKFSAHDNGSQIGIGALNRIIDAAGLRYPE